MFKIVISLLKLDIYSIKPYVSITNKVFLVFTALTISFIQMNPIILPAVFVSLGAGLGTTAFFLGELHRVNIFRAVLFVRRRSVVVARYLLGAFVTLVGGGISFLLMILIWFIRWPEFFLVGPLLVFVLIVIVQYILIISIQFPVYFGAGYAKSKRLSYLSFAPLALLFTLVNMLDRVWHFIVDNVLFIAAMSLLLSVVLLVCSAMLSLHLFEKRDI